MRAGPAAAVLAVVLLGAILGLGAYTFAYAKGWSYLTNDPRACANCHVPHDLLGKYYTKARNGFWHSYYFTTATFPEPIRATPTSRGIAEANCRRCHEPIVEALGTPAHAGAREISCVRCHGSVGHLELSATNLAREEHHDRD